MRGSAAFRTGVAPGGALAPGWVKNELWRKARAVPSLDLRFADNKSLVDATTGASLVTFTRASSGTFVGSDGVLRSATTDEPRFDHNPTTGESLGLLVEEQRTNLLLRSEEFDNVAWALFGTASRTANTTVAPNGTTTADSVTLPVSSGIFQSRSGSANTAYTFSIWIRCDTIQSVRLVINTNLGDPTTLTVTATSSWQRFSITKTTSVGTLAVTSQVDTGGGNTFYLWGAQLEVGAFATSYIPTTTAAATRSADVASITGTAFSSWYRQDEGTVFSEAKGITVFDENTRRYWEISSGSSANRLLSGYGNSTQTRFFVVRDGIPSANIVSFNQNLNLYTKSISTFGNNYYRIFSNGISGQTDNSGNLPSGLMNSLSLGTQFGVDVTTLNGTIKRFTYWPVRLDDPTLQSTTQ